MRRVLTVARFVVPSLVSLFQPIFAYAAGLPTQIVTCNGAMAGNGMPACTACHLAELGQNLLNTTIFMVIFLSALLFAFAGFKYMTEGHKDEGRKIATNVTVGLVIILSSWLVVDTLMKTVLGGSFGPWNNVCAYF